VKKQVIQHLGQLGFLAGKENVVQVHRGMYDRAFRRWPHLDLA